MGSSSVSTTTERVMTVWLVISIRSDLISSPLPLRSFTSTDMRSLMRSPERTDASSVATARAT